jgi:hypothetical protein
MLKKKRSAIVGRYVLPTLLAESPIFECADIHYSESLKRHYLMCEYYSDAVQELLTGFEMEYKTLRSYHDIAFRIELVNGFIKVPVDFDRYKVSHLKAIKHKLPEEWVTCWNALEGSKYGYI